MICAARDLLDRDYVGRQLAGRVVEEDAGGECMRVIDVAGGELAAGVGARRV